MYRDLTVQHCETNTLADSAWVDFERDGDKNALAAKQALFFRTIFAPTLAGALERSDDPEQRLVFLGRLESGLKTTHGRPPQPIHSRVETIVLAKSAARRRSGRHRRTLVGRRDGKCLTELGQAPMRLTLWRALHSSSS